MKTITITLTFDPSNCVDVDADNYDFMPDLTSIMEYGMENYNLSDYGFIEEVEG